MNNSETKSLGGSRILIVPPYAGMETTAPKEAPRKDFKEVDGRGTNSNDKKTEDAKPKEPSVVHPVLSSKYNRLPKKGNSTGMYLLWTIIIISLMLTTYLWAINDGGTPAPRLNGGYDNDISYYKQNSYTAHEYTLPDIGSEHSDIIMPSHYRLMFYADKPVKLIIYKNNAVYKQQVMSAGSNYDIGILQVQYGVQYVYHFIAIQPNTKIAYLFRRT